MAKLNLEVVVSVDRDTIDRVVKFAEDELLHALFYAPSSPVSPVKAEEIKQWYAKLKAAQE